MSKSHFAIIHDYFFNRGGGENLMISISKELKNCDIFTAYNKSYPELPTLNSKLSHLLKLNKFFLFIYYYLFYSNKVKKTAIFSGTYCCFSIKRSSSKKKILYAHSLPKKLFYEVYKLKKPIIGKFLIDHLRKKYFENIKDLDFIIFNSKKTKNKFLYYFPELENLINNKVIYPYSDLDFISISNIPEKKNKNLLFNSRHQSYKNINEALRKISVYCLNNQIDIFLTNLGDDTKILKEKYKNFSNIFFQGYLKKVEYQSLIKNSIAVIFPSNDEDFGIAAVDAYNQDIPVLIRKNAGFSEILNDDYEFFFNDDNLLEKIQNISKMKYNFKYEKKIDLKKLFYESLGESLI